MKVTKRYISILISIMMLFAFAPVSASAAEDAGDDEGQVVNAMETQDDLTEPEAEQGMGDTEQPAVEGEGGENTDDPETPGAEEETTTTTQAAPTTTTTAAPLTLPKVKLSGVTASKTTIAVKWAKVSAGNLKKIQIQYCTNKTFKNHVKSITVAGTKTSKTIRKLTKGTYYYVRVRASAKTDGKTRYSKWSVVKTAKTKGTSPSVKHLSTIYVKVAKGGTKRIKLLKGKGKWSLGGSGVIKFSKKTGKYVTVKPVKAGLETVYCKVGSRTYICIVKVLNNSVGKPPKQDNFGFALVVGQKNTWEYNLSSGMKYVSTSYDKTKGKVSVSVEGKSVKITVKALKPGKFTVKNVITYQGKKENWPIDFVFINGFRGKTKVKKTKANYAKWRKKTIDTMVSADMTSWQITDAIGKLISTGRYSSKGGATGMQLWYGGNGTCVSGAKMMHDFMKDLGIKSRVHFAGKDKGPKDILGYYMQYNKGHKNIYITMGGKTYEMNPQPEVPWPLGTVAR